jgi:penicillin G amidase
MTAAQGRIGFAGAVPQYDGTLTLVGLHGTVTIRRDVFGVAHVRSPDEHDAWFGQGYASAQDRLWQMEYDRLRATGRWAEAAGPAAIAGDMLARRLQFTGAAKADVEAMSDGTRAMFEAYAAGVNAFLASRQPLPVEYGLTGLRPEPWHVLMGVWQQKLAQARLLAMIGPEAYGRLDGQPPPGSAVVLPPSGVVTRLFEAAAAEIQAAADQLGFLGEVEAGSNSWAVHGSRTTTGMPVVCNDSHRALDVPTVYWQVHLSCPEFDAVGATFPGLPGFPHFGHNGSVAWNITHASADYQDLYIEQFDPHDATRYRTPSGWAAAEHSTETIGVRGSTPVEIELWRTAHGPIVHGEPRSGTALSLRYTATDGACRGFEALRPMLAARTVSELHEAQREWVDPVNNLVSADTLGNIGYLTRGYLPIRSSQAHREFPAPGWTGEHEWTGRVPFEQLPQAINPPEGVIFTANQQIVPGDEPYIAHRFAVPSRAERIRELLAARSKHSPAELAAMQGDTTSRPARTWVTLLQRYGPFQGDAERARAMLAGWDGNLLPQSGAALLYAYFRRELTRALFEPVTGARAWAWLTSEEMPALGRMIGQWLANVLRSLEEDPAAAAPGGRDWTDLLPGALMAAWASAVKKAGADPAAWRWDDHHSTNAKHTLTATFPEHAATLNPPRVSVGGDSDTIQASGYGWSGKADFNISNLSVYRQVADLSQIDKTTFVVPGGVCGLPGTEHSSDQLEYWRTHRRIPAHYAESDVAGAAVHTLVLEPGG